MSLPDVAFEKKMRTINWVGMSDVQMPLLASFGASTNSGKSGLTPATIDAFVSLDQNSRGIHMSRLYRLMEQTMPTQELSLSLIENLLREFVSSQEGLSQQAKLEVKFLAPLLRASLLSESRGWRFYPVTLTSIFNSSDASFSHHLKIELTYSSTCPASAALARAIVAEDFKKNSEKLTSPEAVYNYLSSPVGVGATPHAQRSSAWISVPFEMFSNGPAIGDLIEKLELAIKTPVQTLVKRVDEQEFARRNGQNLMFCEDAVRLFADCLTELKIENYLIKVSHFESLHAHNATAEIRKNWGQK